MERRIGPRWRGPYTIARKITPVLYTIDVPSGPKTWHARSMKRA